MGSPRHARGGGQGVGELNEEAHPFKIAALVQCVPCSMTTGGASDHLSQPWRWVASSLSPGPGGGHRWAGWIPLVPRARDGHSEPRCLRTHSDVTHSSPWGSTGLHVASDTEVTLRHRDGPGRPLAGSGRGSSVLGMLPEAMQGPSTQDSGADGEGAWGGTPPRARPPTREGVVLACPFRGRQHRHRPRTDRPGSRRGSRHSQCPRAPAAQFGREPQLSFSLNFDLLGGRAHGFSYLCSRNRQRVSTQRTNAWKGGGPCPPPGQPSSPSQGGRAVGLRRSVCIGMTSSDLRRPSCNPSGHEGLTWASRGPKGFLAPFSPGPSPAPPPRHENPQFSGTCHLSLHL